MGATVSNGCDSGMVGLCRLGGNSTSATGLGLSVPLVYVQPGRCGLDWLVKLAIKFNPNKWFIHDCWCVVAPTNSIEKNELFTTDRELIIINIVSLFTIYLQYCIILYHSRGVCHVQGPGTRTLQSALATLQRPVAKTACRTIQSLYYIVYRSYGFIILLLVPWPEGGKLLPHSPTSDGSVSNARVSHSGFVRSNSNKVVLEQAS